MGAVHRFRLALTDFEALRRAREYLMTVDVATDEFVFSEAAVGKRLTMAIRTSARDKVARVSEVVEWPRAASDGWCKGFLAGIFDAEGSHGECIRIANTDPAIIDWTTWCLRRLRFDFVLERRARRNGLAYVRIRGGLSEQLRFFHTVDPAITRKRTITGKAIKSRARLDVVSIESVAGVQQLFDITTGTGDFVSTEQGVE